MRIRNPEYWYRYPLPLGGKVCWTLKNFDICASISGAVQYKLTNLVLGNSLPLQLQHQQGFIEGTPHLLWHEPVLRIRIRRIHMFSGRSDPNLYPLFRDTDPDPSIIKQKY